MGVGQLFCSEYNPFVNSLSKADNTAASSNDKFTNEGTQTRLRSGHKSRKNNLALTPLKFVYEEKIMFINMLMGHMAFRVSVRSIFYSQFYEQFLRLRRSFSSFCSSSRKLGSVPDPSQPLSMRPQ